MKLSKSQDALLDLGCGLGQMLRQLRADGVDGSRLFGLDNEPRLIQAGYELFRDKEQFDAMFVVADLIDPDDTRLRDLRGKVTIVHAASFFHLFTWLQQLYIGKQLVSFLRPGLRNALIYGRDAGRPSGVPPIEDTGPYIHDEASFQKLWDEIAFLTGTKWRVHVETESQLEDSFGIQFPIVVMNWFAYQVPL